MSEGTKVLTYLKAEVGSGYLDHAVPKDDPTRTLCGREPRIVRAARFTDRAAFSCRACRKAYKKTIARATREG